MKCFRCAKTLQPYPDVPEWIKGGMRFHTTGGYGSRSYDSGHSVSIIVCDVCFEEAALAGEIETREVVEPMVRATYRYRPWNPETDE